MLLFQDLRYRIYEFGLSVASIRICQGGLKGDSPELPLFHSLAVSLPSHLRSQRTD